MDLGNPRLKILGPKVAYDLTLVETHNCAKFHQDWSKGVDLYKEHTNRHSSLYSRLAGVPGVAREVEENDVIKIIISI